MLFWYHSRTFSVQLNMHALLLNARLNIYRHGSETMALPKLYCAFCIHISVIERISEKQDVLRIRESLKHSKKVKVEQPVRVVPER